MASNTRAEAARHDRTLVDIAEGTGIHRVTIGRRLSGQSSFTIDELVAIADYLATPLATLLAGVESEQASA